MNLKATKLAIAATLTLLLTSCSNTVTTQNPSSWQDGACDSSHQGVTLAIDFKGEVTTRCALNYSGNGWELFKAAGIQVKGTAKYPTAFACQINGEPKSAKCDDSETSGAYWGYYLLANGKWDYATTGASDHKSKCGDVEGWVYMETEQTVSHLPTPPSYTCN